VKIDLTRIELPDEHDARERVWELISHAYREYEPRPAKRSRRRPLALAVAAGAVAALVAVAVSPAGSNIVHSVRKAVGIKSAAPALTQLPAPGELLVTSAEGPWIVQPDGSKRLLGAYAEASWSPHGLYVAVAKRHELAAVDPHGTVRWSLARPRAISLPRWSPDGYRIAYLDGSSLRIVNGDGTGDHLFAAAAAPVAAAWRPDSQHVHVLAYVTDGRSLRIENVDTKHLLAKRRLPAKPSALLWTSDAKRLVVVSAHRLTLFGADGLPLGSLRLSRTIADAAVAPASHRLALVLAGGRSEVVTVDLDHLHSPPANVFSGGGSFSGLAWAPNAEWLLVAWPTANQWVFVRTHGAQRIAAVSAISSQFAPGRGARAFPTLAGWCCTP
jgi:dipeptidyl aminopeptidase/acylaminoacyl peptidase